MHGNLKKSDCIFILKEFCNKENRLPKKSDFDEYTVSMIKSYFGPWPRALEAAGIKERDNSKLLKKREKRERAKKNRIIYNKNHPKEKGDKKDEN